MLGTIRAKLTMVVALVATIVSGLGILSVMILQDLSRSYDDISSQVLQKIEIGYGLSAVSNGLTGHSDNLRDVADSQTLDSRYQLFIQDLDRLEELSDQLARLDPGSQSLTGGVLRQASLLRSQSEKNKQAQEELFRRHQGLRQNLITMDQSLRSVLNALRSPSHDHGHNGEWDKGLESRIAELHLRHAQLHSLMVQSLQESDPEKIARHHETYIRQLQDLRQSLSDIRDQPLHGEHQNIVQQLSAIENHLSAVPATRQDIAAEQSRQIWQAQDFQSSVNRLSNGVSSLSATILERSRQELADIEPLRIRGNLTILLTTALGILLVIVIGMLATGRGIASRVERLRDQLVGRTDHDETPITLDGNDELAEIRDALNRLSGRAVETGRTLIVMEKDLRQAREQAEQALAELRTTQRSLIQSEKMASIASLVSNVAHEVNTPLGAAVGVVTHLSQRLERFAAILETGQVKRQDAKAFFEFVSEGATLLQENIERTIELMAQFKQVSRQQDLEEFREVHFGDFLSNCVNEKATLFKDRDIEVAIHCPDNMEMPIQAGAMTQVLTTLLVNSLFHGFESGQKGLITIMASPSADGNGLSIIYEDNGKGMSEEEKDRIFDPYFQSQQNSGGPGLGMLLIYSIITVRLHGTIDVTSIPGEGVRYEIRLPITHDPAMNRLTPPG